MCFQLQLIWSILLNTFSEALLLRPRVTAHKPKNTCFNPCILICLKCVKCILCQRWWFLTEETVIAQEPLVSTEQVDLCFPAVRSWHVTVVPSTTSNLLRRTTLFNSTRVQMRSERVKDFRRGSSTVKLCRKTEAK